MIPLLNACIRKLQEQGMKRLFLDAVTSNVDAFKHLGRSLRNDPSQNLILINYVYRLQGMGRLQRRLARHLSQKITTTFVSL
jgi:hypothetical protein